MPSLSNFVRKIIESGHHLLQPHCSSRATQKGLRRTISSWLLSISKSFGKLFIYLFILSSEPRFTDNIQYYFILWKWFAIKFICNKWDFLCLTMKRIYFETGKKNENCASVGGMQVHKTTLLGEICWNNTK